MMAIMRMRKAKMNRIAAAALAARSVLTAQAADYYVDVSWTGTESGATTAPYKTIKAAVDAANAVAGAHTIYIAGGWYGDVDNGGTEDYSAGGGADSGILITRQMNLYGGYAGWDGEGEEPGDFDWSEGARTPRATVIDLENALSRAFLNQCPEYVGTLFDGLSFLNASNAVPGGALYSPYGFARTLYVNNCVFSNNFTTSRGGAIDANLLYSAGGRIRNSDFVDNRADANGGAIALMMQNHAVLVEDCTFLRNIAGGTSATGRGGAIFWDGFNGPVQYLRRCRLEGNQAVAYGGAVFSTDPRIVMEHCTFTLNSASSGAAIGGNTYWCGSYYLENCLVANNSGDYAVYAEGARMFDAYTLDILHCTIVGNSGGGLRFFRIDGPTPARVRNSIIANNGGYGIYRAGNDCTFNNNNVYGNAAGDYCNCTADAASISADPLFADETGGDYRLAKGSPCIDAGIDAGATSDLDNVGRPTRLGYDIGCYEEWQIPVIANRAAVALPTAAEVRAEFTYESAALDTYAYFAFGTSDAGTGGLAGWDQWAASGEPTQGVIFGSTFAGLSPDTTYWYRCMASNSYDVLWGPAASFKTPAAGGAMRLWTGLGGDALASNTNNWLDGLAPAAEDYVLLDSSPSNMIWDAAAAKSVAGWTQTENYTGTVTFPVTYSEYSPAFTNFAITGNVLLNGGCWTHTANPAGDTAVYRLAVTVDGDFSLGPQGQINADSRGFWAYGAGAGPGAGTGDACGPSHGGQGGFTQESTPAATYGSAFQPVTLGSGGNTGGGWGVGGGAVQLAVAGEARIDGSIRARGGIGNPNRPGAGGSILITAGTVAGAGTLDVRGQDINNWCGGGGGRIAVILTEGTTFGSLATRANGGTGASHSGCRFSHGAAGTIYRQAAGQALGQGTLAIDNNGYSLALYAVTEPSEAMDLNALQELVVTNGGTFAVTESTTLDFASANIRGGGELKLRSTDGVSFPAPFVVTNAYRLCLDTPVAATGDWTVMANAVVTHSPNFYLGPNPERRVSLTLNGNLRIEQGGAFDVTDRGYAGGAGPGAGIWDSVNASHGGQGFSGSGAPRPTYGSVLQPTSQGSGNATGGGSFPGAGAVELSVTGATTIDGAIRANATAGWRRSAGGSVRITTGTLAGGGTVDASAGGTDQAGAGGGRIAVRLTEGASFGSVVLKAYGGDGGGTAQEGAAGTVYKQTAADMADGGIVLVDNADLAPNEAAFTPLPAFAASTEDLGRTQWEARNKGKIGLVADVAVESLALGPDACLELAGHTVMVYALRIDGRSYGAGVYTAADLAPFVTDRSGGSGQVVVKASGTIILLR
jgi:hypothetical protein